MRCHVCRRLLKKAAFTIGRLNFGPVCLKRVISLGTAAARAQADLFDGAGEVAA